MHVLLSFALHLQEHLLRLLVKQKPFLDVATCSGHTQTRSHFTNLVVLHTSELADEAAHIVAKTMARELKTHEVFYP